MTKILGGIDRAMDFVLFLIFLIFSLAGGLQVFNRFVLGLPLSWSEEFQKFGHIWMVFVAIPVAYRRGAHIGMDAVLVRLPQAAQRAIGLLIDLLWLALAAAIIVYTWQLLEVARMQDSPGLGWRMDYVYGGMMIGAGYLALLALRHLAARLWPSLREVAR
jgi:TRAP-type C4-dicarboxylate transport system permease small subunit